MKQKLQNTIRKLYPLTAVALVLILWQCLVSFEIVPRFMLPAPTDVAIAFITEFPLLMLHAKTTILEAILGLLIGVFIGFMAAVLMDHFDSAFQMMYPVIVISQTIPTVAIAPLLVLWLGYEMTPKIVLIVMVTFFPVAVGLLDGFRSADKDAVNLLRAMGSTPLQVFRYIKLPGSYAYFFSSLKISCTYAIIGAVISEWLGGFTGLGVYMTRAKKSFSFDKMFAVIFLISIISLLLMWIVNLLQRKCMPWEKKQ